MSALNGAFKTPDAQQIRVAAEQARLDQLGKIEQAQRRLELDVQRRRAGIQLGREKRRAKAEIRAEKHQAWAERTQQARDTIQTIGRRFLIAGPILAPMAVAWVGQIGFARGTLAWPLVGAFVFAASWELTTAFSGWMYHQARQAGDRGSVFRAATWLFAASAGAMNYWHALDGGPVTDPTPKAVAYGAMSLVGIALWELYASLIHRQGLRSRGALPPARPRFGLARWLRFPRITFRAWSLAIRDGIGTTEEAWARAVHIGTAEIPNTGIQVQVQSEVRVPAEWTVEREPEPAHWVTLREANLNNDAERELDDSELDEEAELELLDSDQVNLNNEPEVQEPTPKPEPASKQRSEPADSESIPEPAAKAARRPRTSGTASLGKRAAAKAAEIEQVLNLIAERGDPNAVKLQVVQDMFPNLKRTTAFNRLAEAKAQWKLNQSAAAS